MRLANEIDEIHVMIITENKEVYFSEGFEDRVTIVHPDYTIKN